MITKNSTCNLLGAVLGCALVASLTEPAAAQSSYTEAQIKLAGQIGSVIGLVDRCGKVPMPGAAIKRAMKAEGLKDSDLTQETAFKARVTNQAKNVKAMETLGGRMGQSDSDAQKGACKNLVEMYGTNGFVRAGLASQN